MQVKTTVRYDFSPVRLAKIQKFDNTLLVRLFGNGHFHIFLVGMQNARMVNGREIFNIWQNYMYI